jgi:hypothetical protein
MTVAKGNDLDERVAVGSPTGVNSAVFKIWSPIGKSDIYASIREHAGVFKISLHDGGECFAGLTKPFADSQPKALSEMGGSRHQSRWTRQTHVGSRVVTPLQFVVPASELGSWREKEMSTNSVRWLPAPTAGRSVIISCIFGGQKLPDADWPGRRNETQLVATKILPNGEKFWLIWQDCATSGHESEMLRQGLEVQQQRKMVRFSGAPDDASLGPRMLIFKEFRLDRLLVVMDSATHSAPDEA